MDGGASVKVAVRVRPFNARERERNAACIIQMQGNVTQITNPQNNKPNTFTYDHSHWSVDRADAHYAGQETVYKDVGQEFLQHAFDGYNVCMFAYGQTGAGKSYTMMGSREDGEQGLIPRLCAELFARVDQANKAECSYSIEVSYMEIYNEKVRDLLNPSSKGGLKVREHPLLGPYVEDLSKVVVASYSDISMLLDEGNKSRTVASTNMNAESSRSHAVFSLVFTQNKKQASDAKSEVASKISLVDLAGSERADSTGARGTRLKEGANINKSLTTLGKVISALAELSDPSKKKKGKETHIPYRDSALTWLLKESLGGNSKTAMIAAISPADINYEETLSTLRYADRAKQIVCKAIVNEDPTAKMIRELKEEVARLQEMLQQNRLTPRKGKAAAAAAKSARRESEDDDEDAEDNGKGEEAAEGGEPGAEVGGRVTRGRKSKAAAEAMSATGEDRPEDDGSGAASDRSSSTSPRSKEEEGRDGKGDRDGRQEGDEGGAKEDEEEEEEEEEDNSNDNDDEPLDEEAVSAQLAMSQKLIEQLNETMEEKIRKSEKLKEQYLKQAGIAIKENGAVSGVFSPEKEPHLLNLSDDKDPSELLVYYLHEGRTTCGSSPDSGIQLFGDDIRAHHCTFINEHGAVSLAPEDGSETIVDDVQITEAMPLRTGANIILGECKMFRFVHPDEVKKRREAGHTPNMARRSFPRLAVAAPATPLATPVGKAAGGSEPGAEAAAAAAAADAAAAAVAAVAAAATSAASAATTTTTGSVKSPSLSVSSPSALATPTASSVAVAPQDASAPLSSGTDLAADSGSDATAGAEGNAAEQAHSGAATDAADTSVYSERADEEEEGAGDAGESAACFSMADEILLQISEDTVVKHLSAGPMTVAELEDAVSGPFLGDKAAQAAARRKLRTALHTLEEKQLLLVNIKDDKLYFYLHGTPFHAGGPGGRATATSTSTPAKTSATAAASPSQGPAAAASPVTGGSAAKPAQQPASQGRLGINFFGMHL